MSAAVLRRLLRHTEDAGDSPLKGRGNCLRWTGAATAKGYGRFRSGGRDAPMVSPHRYLAQLLFGRDYFGPREELTAEHLCRRPWCVNPLHIVPLSRSENTANGNRDRYLSDPWEELGI